ncbi:porin [Celerinatantimonas sp. MCCC 1A17872]|uniref:porin n=1 Tax=Celerinatantimonas sp. MCCC 1A17872 TaxID=3177514 RepID=UPI0038C67D41
MKKTILALAVPALLAASAAATAANVYKTDSQSMDVYGRVEADLTNAGGDKSQEKSTDLDTAARLGIKGTTKLTDGLSAFARGEWQVAGENGDGSKFNARHIYLGLDAGTAGNVKFGQTDTPFYTSLDSTIDIFDQWGMEAQSGLYGYSRQSSQVIYSNDFGPVTLQASYQFKTSAEDTLGVATVSDGYVFDADTGSSADATATPDQDNAYNIAAVYDTGMGLKLRAAYARQNFEGDSKKDNYGFGFDYTNDNLYAAFVYEGAKVKNDGSDDLTVNSYDLVGAYTIGQTRLYSGWGFQRQSDDGASHDGTAVNSFKAGVEYNFTSNFLSWVEYRHNNGASDTANGYAANEFAVSAQYNF